MGSGAPRSGAATGAARSRGARDGPPRLAAVGEPHADLSEPTGTTPNGDGAQRTTPTIPTDPAHEQTMAVIGLTVDRILETVRRHLHVDVAYLSRVDDDEQVIQVTSGDAAAFGLAPGTTIPLDETYCARMLRGDIREVVPDAVADPVTGQLDTTGRCGIGSYIGVAVRRPDGTLHGTLCCASREPDPTLTQRDAQFLRALAALIADQLEQERALTAKHDEFMGRLIRYLDGVGVEAHLQPIVDLATGRVVGAEALARFDDGAPPLTWFAHAARAGVAADLERTVMTAALAHLPALPDDVYLSLNASPGTVLTGVMDEILNGAAPSRLVVEITEHAAIEDYGQVTQALEPLLDRGVRLAIDDAGAGFASFRHVVQLSPDILKLDISLTRDVAEDPVQRSLAEMLAAFADRIGASVVAEGIETSAVLRELRRIDIGFGQGFHFARPAPPPLRRLAHTVT